MSKVYYIKRVQKIPAGIDEVWAFFSSADNLEKITPASA
jgi:ligand-binding SRPBCC domain-containing protein